jgi:hypothetical protein
VPKHGLSPATFYKLKAKYGGMELSDAKRLRQLEDENNKLKRLLVDAMLDNVVLKDHAGRERNGPFGECDPEFAGSAVQRSNRQSL